MESSVTRLLVATKQLLEALNLWAQGRMSETGVSDVYVKLGNDFNAAVAAFGSVRIDMSDLITIPDQLRYHLESALSENASMTVLDQYLPAIRTIIINLLQGLKDKQAQWRAQLSEEKRRNHDLNRLSQHSRDSTISELAARRQAQITSPRPTPPPRGDEFTSPTSSNSNSSNKVLSPPPLPPPLPPSEPPTLPTIEIENHKGSMTGDNNSNNTSTSGGGENSTVNQSLAALKKSDALERRASKRFSSYTMGKMYSSASISGGLSSLAPSTNSTNATSPNIPNSHNGNQKFSNRRISSIRGSGAQFIPDNAPPLPPIPDSVNVNVKKQVPQRSSKRSEGNESPSSLIEEDKENEAVDSDSINVFIKIGNQVKKALIEDKQQLSLAGIRMLFIDRFAYSSGMDDFPLIYIKDKTLNLDYELENVNDITEGSILSLNIEPLDQVKQHIDLQINTLSQDLKDMKSVLSASSRRFSSMAQPASNNIGNNSSSVGIGRPSEKQFQAAAENLKPQPNISTVNENSSVNNEAIVKDLKLQFDNVQGVRRDLGVLRQIYLDFMNDTKDNIGNLRNQTIKVKDLANTQIGGARAYIDTGKSSLDSRSQDVLTKMEEIQDTVDELKHDVVSRRTKPRPQILRNLKQEFENIRQELEALDQQVETVKPMWKKTWAEELQNIVDEQGFLNHQEKLLADLKDDHASSLNVFNQVEQVASLRVNTNKYVIPEIEPSGNSGENLDNVLLEIRNRQNDPEKRLKAIEAAEKQREKEGQLNKINDDNAKFANELGEFVDKKSLKKTGGFVEIDRVRRKKDEAVLQNIFSNNNNNDNHNYTSQNNININTNTNNTNNDNNNDNKGNNNLDGDGDSLIDNESSLIAYNNNDEFNNDV